eukprot:scaffold147237_cov36-Tisochrysis_lutea.AAC.2
MIAPPLCLSRTPGYAISNPYIVAGNLPGCIAAITALVMILPLMKGADSLWNMQAIFVGGSASIMAVWTWLVFAGINSTARASEFMLAALTSLAILMSSLRRPMPAQFSRGSQYV